MGKGVAQLVHTLNYGDAISSEVILIDEILRARDIPSTIYAINTHPKYIDKTLPYVEYAGNEESLFLHYSLGSPLNDIYLQCKSKRHLVYHNLTPAKWYRGVNPRVVKDLIQGKLELPKLCKVSDLIIADSDFNAAEILELGFKAKTLPLSIGENHLLPNEGILNLLRKDNLTHLLHVGRLAPNKCLEDLLKIFYFYHHKINQNSRLWLVGTATDTEIYKYALERLSYELDLSASVTFTGSLSDEEVLAFYQGSSLYITMSEHEGFCLPLMEAARSSLPVLAYASSAIPETLGESGVLVYGKKDPARIAEVIEQIRLDNELKARLIEGGKSRAKVYSVENFTHNFFRILSLKV